MHFDRFHERFPIGLQFSVDRTGVLRRTTTEGDRTLIHDRDYLAALGVQNHAVLRAGDLWRHLVEEAFAGPNAPDESWRDTLETMLDHGPLARRLRATLGETPSREEIIETYGRLADCLEGNELFLPK